MNPRDANIPKAKCDYCGREIGNTGLVQVDSGEWYCTNCRVSLLRERRAWPGQKCDVIGCTLTVKDHIEEFRRIVSSTAWDSRFKSNRDDKKEDVPF